MSSPVDNNSRGINPSQSNGVDKLVRAIKPPTTTSDEGKVAKDTAANKNDTAVVNKIASSESGSSEKTERYREIYESGGTKALLKEVSEGKERDIASKVGSELGLIA